MKCRLTRVGACAVRARSGHRHRSRGRPSVAEIMSGSCSGRRRHRRAMAMPVRRMGSAGDAIARPWCGARRYGRSDRGRQPRFRRCDDLRRPRQRPRGQALVRWPCPRQPRESWRRWRGIAEIGLPAVHDDQHDRQVDRFPVRHIADEEVRPRLRPRGPRRRPPRASAALSWPAAVIRRVAMP